MILKVSQRPPTKPMISSHSAKPKPSTICSLFALHGRLGDLPQELGVTGRRLHLVDQQLEGAAVGERVQNTAQPPDQLKLFRSEQQLLLTGARRRDVDRRKDALLRE